MDISVIFAVFSTFLMSVLVSYSSGAELSEKIDKYVSALTECKGVTGMAVTVVQGDQVLHSRGYGYADLKNERPVRANTRFCVASLTKAFTATLLGLLLDETGHDWDTPIAILMPGLVFPDSYVTQEVTLRDLLSHKVGFPGYDILWLTQSMSMDQLLGRIRYLEPIQPFRVDFTYSNLMYILAGRVAEHIGRRSWELLVRKKILEPLGMNETGFAWEYAVRHRKFARPHRYDPEMDEFGPLPDQAVLEISASKAAASMCTTANDMAKWMTYHLNRKNSQKIPDSFLLDELYKAQTALKEDWNQYTSKPAFPPGKYLDYGLGWFTGLYRGYRYHDHYGFISEYFSHVALLPDLELSVFSSVNGADGNPVSLPPHMLNMFIMDTLIGVKPFKDAQEVCDFMPQERATPIGGGTWHMFTAMIPYEPYIGRYAHPVLGNISVYEDPETEELTLKLGTYKYTLEVDEEAEEEGRFKIKPKKWWTWICSEEDDYVQFSDYEDGEKSRQVSVPCFERGLADMFFERDLKLSDVERYSFEEKPSLKIACVRSGQGKGALSNDASKVAAVKKRPFSLLPRYRLRPKPASETPPQKRPFNFVPRYRMRKTKRNVREFMKRIRHEW